VELKFLGEYIKSQTDYLTAYHENDGVTDTYNFNPCIPFTVEEGSACDGVLACQHHPDLYDIGDGSPSFFETRNGDLKLSYLAKSGGYPRLTEVNCICGPRFTGMPYFSSDGERYRGFYVFEMIHACCCKDTCKDAMTPHGLGPREIKILLILFIVVFVISVSGCLSLMYQQARAIGTEMIPNKSFWSELPSRMKDGVLFVLLPCLKRVATMLNNWLAISRDGASPSQGWPGPSQDLASLGQGWPGPSQGWASPSQGWPSPSQGWASPNWATII